MVPIKGGIISLKLEKSINSDYRKGGPTDECKMDFAVAQEKKQDEEEAEAAN